MMAETVDELLYESEQRRMHVCRLQALAHEALHVIENLRENGPEQGFGFWDEHGTGGWVDGADVVDALAREAKDER